jgi:hypothetical protein
MNGVEYVLKVAVEHLACGKYPRQNWGQFLALVDSTGVFTEEELKRWNDIYNTPIPSEKQKI